MDKKHVKWVLCAAALVLLLVLASLVSFSVGSAGIPPGDIAGIIRGGRGTVEYSILFDVRLPRILLGLAVGGALSISGVMLQGLFRNPLVEPYTLGISGGAALGVCLNIVMRLGRAAPFLSLPLSGFLGAVLVILLVYSLSSRGGMLKIQQMLLTGVMVSFISSSLIMLVLALARGHDLQGIIYWVMGSLQQTSRPLVASAAAVSAAGLAAGYFFCVDLNAFSLGEEEALHLGVNVERTKKALFALSAVLTGMAVSVAGIIGFVGLVVPHLMRLVVGGDYRILLPASFLSGAVFLILCDALARVVIAPLELPVGVITGILGGFVFIYALSKRQVRF